MPSACPSRPSRTAAAAAAAVLLALAGPSPGRTATQPPSREAAAPAEDARAFFARVVAAWAARDTAGWMRLWDLPSAESRLHEETDALGAFAATETSLSVLRGPIVSADGQRATAEVQVFVADEPRARVGYWRLAAERRGSGWALVSRQEAGQVDGLVHLSLTGEAWRARGVRLKLEDFELLLDDGTLYSSGEGVGPTALVFVGRARVRFSPRPPAEREQLRQFSGGTAIDTTVGWAFVRLHPGDFRRVVEADRLQPEPLPDTRRAEAEAVFRSRAVRSFLLDAPLPRSPWWLLPGVGDAVVEFPWRRRRVLTFALSSGEAEDVNLFDRDRRLQICMYASAGRPVHFNEDDRRAVDVLDQELAVRFEPDRLELSAVHTMRLRPLAVGGTLRLRLDDDFRVSSITSGDGASLLYFRVRDQDSIVVSLGTLADRGQPFTLVTRYAGRHDPAPVDQELVQVTPITEVSEDSFVEPPPTVYSNRTSWYPRPANEDFAPARLTFDTPEGWLAVTGGELRALRTEARRTRSEYRLEQPGKFLTAVVGRLADLGLRQEGEQSVRGYGTPRTRSDAAALVPRTQEILAFYSGLFGPCPYPAIGLVLADAETPGGHSPPGLVYLQRRPLVLRGRLSDDPANFSDLPDFFLAHELAHQWWGQGTAPASYRERWLSEAFAQYAAALWVRERAGEGAFRGMMDRMARWATRHDDAGPIVLGQRLGGLDGDPRVFRAVVYDKGAWVIHMLRGVVGDTAFFAGARAFLQEHRFAKAVADDLRRSLEQASGRDLAAYFERWIDDTGLPVVRWSWRSAPGGAGFVTTVEARPEALPGPVPVEISVSGAAGRETRRVVLDPAGGSFTVETRGRPERVALNDDRGLLARFERVSHLPQPAQR
jgi:hypothetical protein